MLRITNYGTPLLAALLAAGIAAPASAIVPLSSEDSSYGLGTITYDEISGLRWLDLTESISISKAQILVEIGPGGLFEGFRLATGAEIADLATHAGIDVAFQNDFVPENHDGVVFLATLLGGPLGTNGNCGIGCTFSFTKGFSGDPDFYGSAASSGLAWFDNSGGLSGSYPLAPLGRIVLEGGSLGEASSSDGSWLVLPEPGANIAAVATFAALAATRRLSRRPRA